MARNPHAGLCLGGVLLQLDDTPRTDITRTLLICYLAVQEAVHSPYLTRIEIMRHRTAGSLSSTEQHGAARSSTIFMSRNI
jgi:hypothetical protein